MYSNGVYFNNFKKLMLGDVVDYTESKIVWTLDDSYQTLEIKSRHINRIGLDLIGVMSEFDKKRIMVMGDSEHTFLARLSAEEIYDSVGKIFSFKAPALFITRNIDPRPEVLEIAKKHGIPVFVSDKPTSRFISELTSFLDEFLSPRITRSAGCMSIHGEGVLISGESGIGKSEVELELIKRGHKFVSDDVTEIKKTSANMIVGSAPGNVSKYIEVRGIGIIDVQRLFGVDAIKISEKIDILVNLENWKENKEYSRLSSDGEHVEILETLVPYVNIPVKPGKNLAVIIEVAAMNNRLKKYGLNSSGEFLGLLGGKNNLSPKNSRKVKCIWEIGDDSK
ncbi:MAG: HPr(Ser) kinase/phosphatase [Oscillospiraceae bacterium]|jgi:HPr kinase/phosphorylase|nr:HPr(Ser) kinase/phosphatase [Oscillospiraceae bacterium]